MKNGKALFLARAALAAALCLAAASTRGATPVETKELVQRQRELKGLFTQQLREKKFGDADATAAALRETLASPACPPEAAGEILLHLGRAFVDPLNLSRADETRATLKEAVAKTVRPMDRAIALFALHRLDMLTCEDADYEAEVAATKAFLENPTTAGLSPLEGVRFLRDSVWPAYKSLQFDFDIVAAMDRTAGTNGQARTEFYGGPRWGAVFIMGRMLQNGSLDPAVSREARLALIERGLADKLVSSHADLPQLKVDALVDLGRSDEAERYILDGVAHTNADLRIGLWYDLLGRFYENASKRYYSKPDAALVGKAIAAYRQALDKNPAQSTLVALADLCTAAGDYDGALEPLGKMLEANRGATNDVAAVRLGNVAFARKDYAAAAAHYALVARPDALTQERLAASYNAVGDYANCAATLEKLLPTIRNRYKRPHLEFCLQKARERAGKD